MWPRVETTRCSRGCSAKARPLWLASIRTHSASPTRMPCCIGSSSALAELDSSAARESFAALTETSSTRLGPDYPDTLTALSNLASWRGAAGDAAGAAAAFEALLADQLRVLGPDHPDTLTTCNNLAYSRHKVAASS